MLDWVLTITVLLGSIGLGILSNWQAGRPPREDLRPRIVPWRFVMILSAFLAVLSVVHLANLFGIETGPEHSPLMRGR